MTREMWIRQVGLHNQDVYFIPDGEATEKAEPEDSIANPLSEHSDLLAAFLWAIKYALFM